MITSDLIEYIKSQLNDNVSKELIISNLIEVGWKVEDINEGFASIEPITKIIQPVETVIKEEVKLSEQPKEDKNTDPYREFPDGIDIEKENPYQVDNKADKNNVLETKAEPLITTEIKQEVYSNQSKKNITESLDQKNQSFKVWTPSSIKPKEEIFPKLKEEKEELIPKIENKIENFNLELEAGDIKPSTTESISEVKKIEEKIEEKQEDIIPIISKNRFDSGASLIKESVPKKIEEVVPVKPIINPVVNPMVVPVSTSTVANTLKNVVQPINNPVPVNTMKDVVPRNAIISSYSQDILAASKEKEEPKTKKKGIFIKIGILLIVLAIIGSMVFAFVEGYVKIPWVDWKYSVVKKDPKVFLLGASESLSELSSYKVETDIDISIPSLSSITTGLVNGESVNDSKDRDFILFNTKGIANRAGGKLNFQYLTNISSSVLKNDIENDLKYDGKLLYASVPDLSEILKKDAPQKNNVSFTPDQLSLVVNEFSSATQNIIKKIDGYSISSGKIPLYVKTKIKSIFEEFINSLSFVEKGKETIHNVETYHYEITVDRQSTKKLLVSLSDLFVTSATDEQKKELDEMLGASSISSFDVWIGIEDNNLYQIKFTFNTPLSQILKLNDSGIAGNEMKIEWRTTYYDLNVPNNILMPEQSIDMETFVNEIKDTKIKNIISSFKPEANALKNSIGSYGLRTNPTGSCTNPNPGSLFSPLGHKKGSETAVGGIAEVMTSLLSVSSGAGSCYSTPKEWSISVPLYIRSEEESSKFFCTDSSGNSLVMTTPINGTFCK